MVRLLTRPLPIVTTFTSPCLSLGEPHADCARLKRARADNRCDRVDPIRDERGWAFRDGPGYSPDPSMASRS